MEMKLSEEFTESFGLHPATRDTLKYLDPNPNLRADQAYIAQRIQSLVHDIIADCDVNGPQLTIGLNKLIEAKDALVRASLDL
jgi:hypothetical protein